MTSNTECKLVADNVEDVDSTALKTEYNPTIPALTKFRRILMQALEECQHHTTPHGHTHLLETEEECHKRTKHKDPDHNHTKTPEGQPTKPKRGGKGEKHTHKVKMDDCKDAIAKHQAITKCDDQVKRPLQNTHPGTTDALQKHGNLSRDINSVTVCKHIHDSVADPIKLAHHKIECMQKIITATCRPDNAGPQAFFAELEDNNLMPQELKGDKLLEGHLMDAAKEAFNKAHPNDKRELRSIETDWKEKNLNRPVDNSSHATPWS